MALIHFRHYLLQSALEDGLGVELVHARRQCILLELFPGEARCANDQWLVDIGSFGCEELTDQGSRLTAVAYGHLVVHKDQLVGRSVLD